MRGPSTPSGILSMASSSTIEINGVVVSGVSFQSSTEAAPVPLVDELPIPENLNRVVLPDDVTHASGIDAALSALSTTETELDRHPERRVRAVSLFLYE